jgi:hypothetical protein
MRQEWGTGMAVDIEAAGLRSVGDAVVGLSSFCIVRLWLRAASRRRWLTIALLIERSHERNFFENGLYRVV